MPPKLRGRSTSAERQNAIVPHLSRTEMAHFVAGLSDNNVFQDGPQIGADGANVRRDAWHCRLVDSQPSCERGELRLRFVRQVEGIIAPSNLLLGDSDRNLPTHEHVSASVGEGANAIGQGFFANIFIQESRAPWSARKERTGRKTQSRCRYHFLSSLLGAK